jgi:hypothetical protein
MIEADVSVFVVNPRRIKAFRDAEGLIPKTDKPGRGPDRALCSRDGS